MAADDDKRRNAAPPTRGIAALADRFDAREPHQARGPFTRWPGAADGVLAVAVFAASVASVALSQLDDGESFGAASVGDLPASALAMLAVAAAALWWRRARPVAVTGVVLTVMVLWAIAGYGDGQDLAVVFALYCVGRYVGDSRQGLTIVAVAAGVGLLGSVIDAGQRVDVLPAVLLTALPWYVGRRVRERGDYLVLLKERAKRLEAEQHARAREAVATERTRIARELHDVVAHQVSMMTVQAGAAKTIARADLDTAIEAMGDVERAGREALGELRHLLGVLRRDTGDAGQLGPQPGLSDVQTLVDELRRTGAHVTLTVADQVSNGLRTALDLSVFRIVQESCTNIVKHAGPDPTVEVSVSRDDDTLVVSVVNTLAHSTGAGMPGSGYGIAGMRERAALLGGTLTAGRQPPNAFHVNARLPLEPDTP